MEDFRSRSIDVPICCSQVPNRMATEAPIKQVSIDVEKIYTCLNVMVEEVNPISEDCCIYRIPKPLRQTNEAAFTPQLISIGPYHYHNEELKASEVYKKRFLKDFLKLSSVGMKEFIGLVKDSELRLKNCYADPINLTGEEFVKMILLDAVFVLMVLVKNYFNLEPFGVDKKDGVFGKPRKIRRMKYDMFLLENQLPFFILEDLFKLSKIEDLLRKRYQSYRNTLPEGEAMVVLIKNFTVNGITHYTLKNNYSTSKLLHLVDFLRCCYVPTEWNPERKKRKTSTTPGLMELHQAGVKLMPGPPDNMFDIKFVGGSLKIPPFQLFRSSELLFLNQLAFEQCQCLDNYFADYVAIMVQLIKSPEDAELLVQHGIENWAGSPTEISNFFHNVEKKNIINSASFLYADITEDLHVYCKQLWPRWNATLKQKYFKAPWAIVSVTAAAFLLVLTIIQTVCSILQV